ncbi:MAG: aquaporin [Clostridiales bacterium]|jgi:aquaporin Z|nr:aquaporin [Clostridiales bacterium]
MALKKYVAEGIGTFALVLFGCGVAVATGVNWVATSLAFGLSIVAMAYCIGKISGCHVNPAVSLAMAINKKISWKDFLFYCIAQLAGAAAACLVLGLFFGGFERLGANQVQDAVLRNYNIVDGGATFVTLLIGLIAEIVLTFIFVMSVLGATHKAEEGGFAGLVIGGSLTLVHLLGLYVTGTSVNPARSIMPAIFQAFTDTTALSQIWIFIVGPFLGAALAAVVWGLFTQNDAKTITKEL